MTHHVGYTLLFEQALQLVDPSVSIPYWEYTIECTRRLSAQKRVSSVCEKNHERLDDSLKCSVRGLFGDGVSVR